MQFVPKTERKERSKAIQDMELLPRELVSNVLSRLPTKDLMLCKCVCKLWFHIITDPHFIENYYVFYNSLKEQLLLIRTPNYMFGVNETEISILSWNPNNPKEPVSSRIIDHPYENTVSNYFRLPFGHWMDIMGPCNGIYFLRGSPNVIMNPSLRQFIDLPESHFTAPHGTRTHPSRYTHFPMFGFDLQTKDYKVVVLKQLFLEDTNEVIEGDWAVELYSLNSNTWRNLGADAIPFPFVTGYTNRIFPFVNNCCHWFGHVHNSDDDSAKESVVLSFDMVNELFRKIKVPQFTRGLFKRMSKELVPCIESTTIGVLHYYFVDQGTDEWFCFDVWILKDYWDEGSWINRYSVGPMSVIYNPLVGYYGSNQSLWIDANQNLVLYGLECEEHTRELLVCESHERIGAVRHMESLVSLQRGMGSTLTL